MAITYNDCVVDIAQSSLPAGFVKPTISTFEDQEAEYLEREFTVDKTSVDDPTGSTTFTALMVALNVLISALLTAELNATPTTTAFARLSRVRLNVKVDEELYTNVAQDYLCTVKIFYKTA